MNPTPLVVTTIRFALDRSEKWYGRLFVVGLGVAIAGTVLIPVCLWASAVVALVGCVLATGVGLALLNPGLRRWSKGKRWSFTAIGGVCLIAGAFLLAVAFSRNAMWFAIAGVWFGVTGILILKATWRVSAVEAPIGCIPAALVLTLSGLLLLQLGGLGGLLGAAMALGGLVLYASGLRGYIRSSDGEPRWVTWAGAAVVAAGVACLVSASRTSSPPWAIAGAALMVLGLIALGLCSSPLRDHPAAPIAAGVTTVVAGSYLLHLRLNTTVWLSAGVVLIVLVLATSFVARGEVLVLVVAAGLATVWVVGDRTTTAPLDPNKDADTRILAIGDSYMAGEGAPDFFPGTNTKGPKRNECRRSATAYPYLLAKDRGWGLDFFACSGATAPQLHRIGQMPAASPDDIVGERPQLADINESTRHKIKLVLVSIGGNDALFGPHRPRMHLARLLRRTAGSLARKPRADRLQPHRCLHGRSGGSARDPGPRRAVPQPHHADGLR